VPSDQPQTLESPSSEAKIQVGGSKDDSGLDPEERLDGHNRSKRCPFVSAVAQEHRQFLGFAWRDDLFEFKCQPFGLSSAPRLCTKLLKPVIVILRQKGIRCIVFLDDLLTMARSQEELERQQQEILLLLQPLGFRIMWDKLKLSRTQQIEYLSLLTKSLSLTLSLSEEKVRGIVQSCN